MELLKNRHEPANNLITNPCYSNHRLLRDFETGSLVEAVLTGCLLEYLEYPLIRSSFQVLHSLMFEHLQEFPLLLNISNELYKRSDTIQLSQSNAEDFKREIGSMSNKLMTSFGIHNDFFVISSLLNCRIVIIFEENCYYVTNNPLQLSPTVKMLQLTCNGDFQYGLLIQSSYENISKSQSTQSLESRQSKLRKINKMIINLKHLLESPLKSTQDNNLSISIRASVPVIPTDFPKHYNSIEKIKPNQDEEVRKDLSNIKVPSNPFLNFNIFQKFNPDFVVQALKTEKKWTRDVKNHELKGFNTVKNLEDFSVTNKRDFETHGLEKRSFFYEFPFNKKFEDSRNMQKHDLSSDSEEEKLKPEKDETKETPKVKQEEVKVVSTPIIKDKPLENPPNPPCKLCEIYDYFEHIEFDCRCAMCIECYAVCYNQKSCIKCFKSLRNSDINKIKQFL